MLPISDITNFTLQDFPKRTACIIWFAGCNLRCKYCHNKEFVENIDIKFLSEEKVLEFLKKRIDLLEGVVLSGGECTMATGFLDFVEKIKNLGYKIKIDTNGLNYDIVNDLVNLKLVDFVALDFKANPEKFYDITQRNRFESFNKTLLFLIEENNKNNIELEIRTTVHTDLLDENDINGIIKYLDENNYKSSYFIQNFRNDNKNTLGNIEDQKRLIDKNLIIQSKNFSIGYRNFF